MRFKVGPYFLFGCCYLSLMAGLMIAGIGEPPSPPSPLEWYDAIIVLFILAVPFVAGICAGRDSMED